MFRYWSFQNTNHLCLYRMAYLLFIQQFGVDIGSGDELVANFYQVSNSNLVSEKNNIMEH